MFFVIFLLLIVNIFLLISILSTLSEINDNILDTERYFRSIPKSFLRSQKGKK